MIGKKVRIKKDKFEGNVEIIDKMMTNTATFKKAAIMNNTSLEVYIGKFETIEDMENAEVNCPVIEFLPTQIVKFL